MDAALVRPARADEPDNGLHLSSIRQRIESVFWTCKDVLTLERHGARTIGNLRVRIAMRLLALAACISLNHQLGRPSRSLVPYVARARGISHLACRTGREDLLEIRQRRLGVENGANLDISKSGERMLGQHPMELC